VTGKQYKIEAFTLIELLVSVLVFSVFAAVVVTAVSDTVDQKAEIAAVRIEAAITFAKTSALSQREVRKVVFDATTETVQVENGSGNIVFNPISYSPYSWVLENGEIQSADFGGNNYLEWSATGEVLAGGTVVVQYTGLVQTFTVTSVTGRVTVGEVRN
jgi:prepilin-type N-terminal cleavage/methylation domain-containing protein